MVNKLTFEQAAWLLLFALILTLISVQLDQLILQLQKMANVKENVGDIVEKNNVIEGEFVQIAVDKVKDGD